MITRWVVHHPEWGVFLGEALGLGFWSLMDPVGQPVACTFPSKDAARAWIETHAHSQEREWAEARVCAVQLDATAQQDDGSAYASVAACIAAGLPGWDPEWSPQQTAGESGPIS